MIIMRVEEQAVATEAIPTLACPHCHTLGKIEMSIIRRGIYLGYIPVLAAGKHGEAECHDCGRVVQVKEGGEPFKSACEKLKGTVKTPLYLSSGLIACLLGLAAIVGTVAFQDSRNPYTQAVEQALLDAPRAGDLYEVSAYRQDSGNVDYTLARVERTGDGVVTLRWHRKVQPTPSGKTMPFLQDFPTGVGDFGGETMDAQATRLRGKSIVRPGAKDPNAEEVGSIVATLRPKAP